MITIELRKQKGKQWSHYDNGYLKGFAFKFEKLLHNEILYQDLYNAIKENILSEFLHDLNGNFSAVLEFNNRVYLISDKLRSYPVFYYLKDRIIVTDDTEFLFNELSYRLDYINSYELLSLGYLSCEASTLIEDVSYVVAGNYTIIDKIERKARNICYHSYIRNKVVQSKQKLFIKAGQVLEDSFRRMLIAVGNRPLVIPLSGGYDSRLIACLCKKFGLTDVTCYTYGRKDSFEVAISKQVAEVLGYKWYFIEYTNKLWYDFINSPNFDEYCEFSGNITGNPCFQELSALIHLKDNGFIKENAVIVPGYFADLLGGSKIPTNFDNKKKIKNSLRVLCELIFDNFYDLNELNRQHKRLVKNKIKKEFALLNINTSEDILDNYEPYWFIKSKIANFIINATRMYEYLNFDWYLPLADDAYQNIWYEVPWHDKYNSTLYNGFLFSVYFRPLKVDFNKSVIKLSFRQKLISRILSAFPNYMHKMIVNAWTELKSKFKSKTDDRFDVNNFITASILIHDDTILKDYPGISNCKKNDINAVVALYYLNLLKRKTTGYNNDNNGA